MKKLNKVLKAVYPVVGSVLTTIALVGGVKPLSFWTFYQPKAPKSLYK